jgi:predicted GNAT family acetyltransferase
MSDGPDGVRVEDVPDRGQFQARIGDEIVGYLAYRRRPGRIALIHTEVDPAFEGRGVGSALARSALDAARSDGLRVRVGCPFVTVWLRRHREYDDVVDRAVTTGAAAGG